MKEKADAADGSEKEKKQKEGADDVVDVIASLEANPEIKKLVDGYEEIADHSSKQKLESYMTQCRRLVASNVTLLVETESDDAIIAGMQRSAAAQVRLDAGGMVGVFYDVKLAGEASAQPNVRMPPLRDAGGHLQKLVGLKIRASSADGEIPSSEIWFIPDAGKDGNKGALLSGFTAGKPKEVRPLLVVYDENSLEDRLDKLRGYRWSNKCWFPTLVGSFTHLIHYVLLLHYFNLLFYRGGILGVLDFLCFDSLHTNLFSNEVHASEPKRKSAGGLSSAFATHKPQKTPLRRHKSRKRDWPCRPAKLRERRGLETSASCQEGALREIRCDDPSRRHIACAC